MANRSNNRKNRKLLTMFLTACMATTLVAGLTSCNKTEKDVDDSEISVTAKDTDRVKNGSFEFFDDNNGKNLIITSVSNWTKSVGSSSKGSASTSKTASGIIDVSEKGWETYTKTTDLLTDYTDATAAGKVWDKLTVRDKLRFIKEWKAVKSSNDVKDLSFYDKEDIAFSYNVGYGDLPTCENPGTHFAESEKEEGKNDHVLMLHNSYENTSTKIDRGTAQKYTSSTTVTLEPGTSAVFSVWVKTADLMTADSNGDAQQSVSDRGAYIGITNKIGSTELDQIQVKNIDTSVINPTNENNGWVQYSFTLKGSTYAQSSFQIVLGLGQGGGNSFEYVKGYAFFDDIKCKVVRSNEVEYDDVNDPVDTIKITAEDPIENKLQLADKGAKNFKKYYIDLASDFDAKWFGGVNVDTVFGSATQTTETKNGIEYNSGITATSDYVGFVSDVTTLQSATSETLKAYYEKDFKSYPFGTNGMYLMFSESGAPYTVSTSNFTLAGESYGVLSFWLKTSDFTGGFTGAGVVARTYDGTNVIEKKNLFTNVSAYDVKTTSIDEDGSTQEDIYDGWQQYFVAFKNETTDVKTVNLTFNYGPTSISTTKPEGYRDGYVAFANFETATLTEDEFKRITTGTYAQTVSYTEEKNTANFDSVSSVPADQIENGFATPQNYSGVYAGSGYVVWNGETETGKNNYEYAGLLNAEYLTNYQNSGVEFLKDLPANFFEGTNQPLVIYNKEEMAYGYIGAKNTFASSSYNIVTVRVKATAGAVANIYLIENGENGYDSALEVKTNPYIYYYNADGNVCSVDPTSNDYSAKHDVALNLNSKGLYEANTAWSKYDASMSGKMYANLNAYTEDEDGNLVVNANGTSYNYDSSVYKHQGNDGIAFYGKEIDGVKHYYAYSNYTVEVFDFSTIADLPNVSSGAYTNTLSQKVVGTGDWISVWFLVHTGSESKNYRVEVWSGDRTGAQKNAAGSYVMFDQYAQTLSIDETSFNSQIDEIKGSKTTEEFKQFASDPSNGITLTYNKFSFFDTDKFLRYDESLDIDDVGNSYGSYDATTYSEGISYLSCLYSENGNAIYKTFADYSLSEVAVEPDVKPDDDTSDDKPKTETKNEMNIWLLGSSILLAVLLVAVGISLGIRKFLKKHHHYKVTPSTKKNVK